MKSHTISCPADCRVFGLSVFTVSGFKAYCSHWRVDTVKFVEMETAGSTLERPLEPLQFTIFFVRHGQTEYNRDGKLVCVLLFIC
jgi:hypothetical protein